MIVGIIASVLLSVANWALMERAQPGRELTMAKEVDQYCLTRFTALAMNHTSGIAVTMSGMFTIVAIVKTLVLNAINILSIQLSILDYET